VELREARAELEQLQQQAQREHQDRLAELHELQQREAAAQARLATLKSDAAACTRRREELLEQIRQARLERDGPVQRVGLYNEAPARDDWSVRDQRKHLNLPPWVPLVGAVLFLLAVLVAIVR